MLPPCVIRELEASWFPHMTDAGLDRVINLLEKGSPMLIHGTFAKATAMGCLATHVAWHHPETQHLSADAGITWLTRLAHLNPATSHVIREWDGRGPKDWNLRDDVLQAFMGERDRRQSQRVEAEAELQPV
jgi:hypothetical protein